MEEPRDGVFPFALRSPESLLGAPGAPFEKHPSKPFNSVESHRRNVLLRRQWMKYVVE